MILSHNPVSHHPSNNSSARDGNHHVTDQHQVSANDFPRLRLLPRPRIDSPTAVRSLAGLPRRSASFGRSRPSLRLHPRVLSSHLSSVPPRSRLPRPVLFAHPPRIGTWPRPRSAPRLGRRHAETEPLRLRHSAGTGGDRAKRQHQHPDPPAPGGRLCSTPSATRRRTPGNPSAGASGHRRCPHPEPGTALLPHPCRRVCSCSSP